MYLERNSLQNICPRNIVSRPHTLGVGLSETPFRSFDGNAVELNFGENMGKGHYLYCVIESKRYCNFGRIGINGNDVYTVNYKDLGGVISNSIESKPVEVLKEGITHQKVVEEVMKKFPVIPMRFGQVPKNEDDVKGFLLEHYDKLKKLFRKIESKVELGVKATWKMDRIMKEIVNSNDRIRILQKQISSLPEEKGYMLKIELGRLVADELQTHGKRLGEKIFDSLRVLSMDSRMNDLIGDRMILNAAFLVPTGREEEFDRLVNKTEERYPEVMIKYVVSPPYNFVGAI